MTYCHHYEVIVDRLQRNQRRPALSIEQQRTGASQAAVSAPAGNNDGSKRPKPLNGSETQGDDAKSEQHGSGRQDLTVSGPNISSLPTSAARERERAASRRSPKSGDRHHGMRRSAGGDGDSDGDSDEDSDEDSDAEVPGDREVQGKPSASAPPAQVPPPGANRRSVHWSLSRGFASGAIVPSSLPETLLCQAFYNPAIIMIVEALLDPKGLGYSKAHPKGDASFSDDDSDGPASPGGRSVESFLAQIAPPRRFFTQAMLTGNRPNFQVRGGGGKVAREADGVFLRHTMIAR